MSISLLKFPIFKFTNFPNFINFQFSTSSNLPLSNPLLKRPHKICLSGDVEPRAAPSARQKQGVVFVTLGSSRDVKSMMLHLHAAGIQHATEVRKLKRSGSARGCAKDKTMHQFVEEVMNGSGWPPSSRMDYTYQCER